MKTMSCEQLGGACQEEFSAASFQDIAELSQAHGKKMFAANDPAHMSAMAQMMQLMQSGGMDGWMSEKEELFNSL